MPHAAIVTTISLFDTPFIALRRHAASFAYLRHHFSSLITPAIFAMPIDKYTACKAALLPRR